LLKSVDYGHYHWPDLHHRQKGYQIPHYQRSFFITLDRHQRNQKQSCTNNKAKRKILRLVWGNKQNTSVSSSIEYIASWTSRVADIIEENVSSITSWTLSAWLTTSTIAWAYYWYLEAVSRIVYKWERTATNTCTIVDIVVNAAEQAGWRIARLAVRWTSNTSKCGWVGRNRAVLVALAIVKQIEGSVSGIEALLTNQNPVLSAAYPASLDWWANIGDFCNGCGINYSICKSCKIDGSCLEILDDAWCYYLSIITAIASSSRQHLCQRRISEIKRATWCICDGYVDDTNLSEKATLRSNISICHGIKNIRNGSALEGDIGCRNNYCDSVVVRVIAVLYVYGYFHDRWKISEGKDVWS